MIDEALLEKAYPSRPRKIFIPWAIIFTIFLLATVFAKFMLPGIPTLLEKINIGEFTMPWLEAPISMVDFIAVYGCPLLLILTTLLTGFLTISLSLRKWFYHLVNTLIVICLLAFSLSFAYNVFGEWLLKENAPAQLGEVSKMVFDIGFYACLGVSAFALLLCYFDNYLTPKKYKAIYKRLKLVKNRQTTKVEKKYVVKKFNKLYKKKKYSEILLLLFEFEFDVNNTEPITPDAYEVMKRDILDRARIIRGKELDALYSSSSYLALRQERKILIDKQNGMSSPSISPVATSSEAKVEIINDSNSKKDETVEMTPPTLSKKELKAAKKAEKKALKEAEKEKKRNEKANKKDDLIVENPEIIPAELDPTNNETK